MADEKNQNETGAGADFQAGFNSDDEVVVAGANKDQGAAAGAGQDPGATAGAEGAGAAPVEGADAGAAAGQEGAGAAGAADGAEGVDKAKTGEQVAAQQEELDLSTLPDNVRQIIETSREEARKANETLARSRQDFAALHGKLAPTQQRADRLQRELEQRTQAAHGGSAASSADATDELAQAESYFESAAFQDYAKTWPEEAKIMKETQLRTLRAAVGKYQQLEQMITTVITPQLQELRQQHRSAEQQSAIGRLEQEHPDWQQHNQSDEFWNWFAAEEPYMNFTNEAHRKERLQDQTFVSHLLTRYKRESGFGGPTQQQPVQIQDQQQVTQQQPKQTSARLQMAASPDIKGGAGPVRQGVTGISPGDQFAAGFNSPD